MAKNRVAVRSLKHNATKKNLPTIENEGFVPKEIRAPKAVDYPRPSLTLYPRNPAADPQLVWRGKDQEDADGDLAINALPIFVHEHITPLGILQSLIDDSHDRLIEPELFEHDFNGLSEAQRLKFYEYDEHWTNRLILGDSLAVMASLSERETLRGKIQTIFMDPPYGVDFKSNWQVATNNKDVRNGKATDITTDPEQIRAYRDTWKTGIHSYLSYMRDRLTAARDLLNEAGSIFVQISDDNEHLVRSLLDEVFGVKNYCQTIVFAKTTGLGTVLLPTRTDYILWYAKDRTIVKYRQMYLPKVEGEEGATQYDWVHKANGEKRRLRKGENLEPGDRLFHIDNASAMFTTPHLARPLEIDGKMYPPPPNRQWQTTYDGMERLRDIGRLLVVGKSVRYVRYLDDFPAYPLTNTWLDTGVSGFGETKVYVVQTNSKVIERCLLMTTDPGDLVMDPTCGGGTTAYCAEKWGRRWITIDTSRVALMLTRTRLMSAKFYYYVLADSHEGRIAESRLSGVPVAAEATQPRNDVKKGFVYERVPHITLKSIAQNENLRKGMAQEEINAAIRRTAEMTYFFDRLSVDKAAVRVSGPFTVESLAPGSVQPLDDFLANRDDATRSEFVALIIDNLQASGMSNGEKGGRTRFSSVEPFPGEYINAIGIAEDGQRYAIAIGPKEGTISKRYMIDAGREALDEALADALAVCGFAFEDAAQTERLGALLVLKVRMNQDLQLGDLLRKSKAANLFQVYGEPDVQLETTTDDQCVITVRGMDIFDPAKRDIRSAGTDKIQAWFIDTNYDGERFIVRQAYFLGDDDVFEDLKRALKGEIDAEAWASLYSDRSRPFPRPKTGKIAVKVITVFGDEAIVVLKPS